MGTFRSDTNRRTLRAVTLFAAFSAFLLLLLYGHTALAADAKAAGSLSEADKTCLGCHASPQLKKRLANKETLNLYVDGNAFAQSVHHAMGCTSCHADIDLAKHPQMDRKIASTREFSIAMASVCRQCHDDKFKQYEGSIHAALVRQGNPVAPVCTDCHGVHDIQAKAALETLDGVSCRKCHENVYNAYLGSVHGEARAHPGARRAPICADCHHAHDIAPPSTSNQPRNACLGCHPKATAAHEKVFPNAARHLQAIACAVCHVPNARRKVDLRIYDTATKLPILDRGGKGRVGETLRSVDAGGTELGPQALAGLLDNLNREGLPGKAVLRGRLELESGVQAHEIADKSKALRTCETCHRQGATPFQSVTISVVGPDGRPVRYDASKEVLSSMLSMETIRGFYAIGGTRIKLLDVLLALALLAGISVPVLHLVVRKLSLKRRAAVKRSSEHPPRGGSK